MRRLEGGGEGMSIKETIITVLTSVITSSIVLGILLLIETIVKSTL